jgi:intracellular multiplication protein IcmF
MDNLINALSSSIKKLASELKSLNEALSFTLIIGQSKQGKSTILRQSNLQHVSVDSEHSVEVYYNQEGIILEFSDVWLNENNSLLQTVIKKLNRCHSSLSITGVLLCIDINEFLNTDPTSSSEYLQYNNQLLSRIGLALDNKTNLGLLFTKLDSLAGFSEFYQNEHVSDLSKPLGFSVISTDNQKSLLPQFKRQFSQLLELLEQQVLNKIHPVRSSVKRTLIREFPLQVASLNQPIQSLIQALPLQLFHLQALYFTSAEQGGLSHDRLTKKIKHEYALSIQETLHQSVYYKPYFVDGALLGFQRQNKVRSKPSFLIHKRTVATVSTIVTVAMIWLGYTHYKSSHALDDVSKALLMYNSVTTDPSNQSNPAFHLTQASNALDNININAFSMPELTALKSKIKSRAHQHLYERFLPNTLGALESVIAESQSNPAEQYSALKIYIMLSDRRLFSYKDVLEWYENHWCTLPGEQLNQYKALLKQIIKEPLQPITINQQLVNDTRNYLNALPSGYLYYSLAKPFFKQQSTPVVFDGFQLPSDTIPYHLTKEGYFETANQLPAIYQQLKKEAWVLKTNPQVDVLSAIQQAYNYEYITYWKQFIKHVQPSHFSNYQQARQIITKMMSSNTIPLLVNFIQQQTSPNFDDKNTEFNEQIASQFTQLNLLTQSALNDLSTNLKELGTFLNTLAIINDHGKTAFLLSKARFNGDTLSNPLSAMFNKTEQLPSPVSNWTNQIAGEFWYLLINDAKHYINQQWQEHIYQVYANSIEGKYPFDNSQSQDVAISSFERFFSTNGLLNRFVETHVKPYMDTSSAQWKLKEVNGFVLPIQPETLQELMRANVITNMFFPTQSDKSHIEFSLQKINLDSVVAKLNLKIGNTHIQDTRSSNSYVQFEWPQSGAILSLDSIEGNHYELDENGPWALFKLLDKVNVIVDDKDSSRMQILFEVNGNSGRYILKTHNQVNPFIPGILSGFKLPQQIS